MQPGQYAQQEMDVSQSIFFQLCSIDVGGTDAATDDGRTRRTLSARAVVKLL